MKPLLTILIFLLISHSFVEKSNSDVSLNESSDWSSGEDYSYDNDDYYGEVITWDNLYICQYCDTEIVILDMRGNVVIEKKEMEDCE